MIRTAPGGRPRIACLPCGSSRHCWSWCSPAAVPAPPERQLVVFAAASLQAAFTDLAGAFTQADPGSAVELSTAGSATLLSQLTQGAAADVLATADTPTMDRAARRPARRPAGPFRLQRPHDRGCAG